jgi:opacity protein-like surface antigen
MKNLLITLVCLGVSLSGILAQGAPEPRARVDVGGGAVFIQGETSSSTPFNMGPGVTLGVLFKNGVLLRFDLGRIKSKDAQVGDFGFGLDTVQSRETLTHLDATAGYLWNRAGMVRPYLRGGLAWSFLDEKVDSALFGELVSGQDYDQVFTYGGGVEIGEKSHILSFDFQKTTNANLEISGLTPEFDLTIVRVDYRYRF